MVFANPISQYADNKLKAIIYFHMVLQTPFPSRDNKLKAIVYILLILIAVNADIENP